MIRRRSDDGRARSPRRRLPVIAETSAGGVVIRKRHGAWHVALLKTRHTRGEVWVLPKGHIEHHRGEPRDAAAVREVREELGIRKVRVIRKLGTVRWQFRGTREHGLPYAVRPGGKGSASVLVRKTVHHFLMEGLSDTLRPQKEEGFLEARWIPVREALTLLAYPTDRAIVAKCLERPQRRRRRHARS